MIPIHNDVGKVRGHEILYFEHAELEKVKGNHTSFATFGPLSVLYFKDFNRYVLLINDWKYPLLRRLPILGLDSRETENRTYYLPAPHGFAFVLKIHKAHGSFPFQNLDTILEHNSRFTWKNLDQPFRKAEESPDDHLSRHVKSESASGKEMITESLKQGLHHMKTKIETLKHGTKNLMSKKKRVDQKDLKTKDFRKEGHSKLKKSWMMSSRRSVWHFWQARLGNLNNITVSKYEDLKNRDGPSLYLSREELEEVILNNKDIAAQGLSSFQFALQKEDKTNMFESIWSETSTRANSISGSIVGQGPMEAHSRRETAVQREKAYAKIPETEMQLDRMTEGMIHYQG